MSSQFEKLSIATIIVLSATIVFQISSDPNIKDNLRLDDHKFFSEIRNQFATSNDVKESILTGDFLKKENSNDDDRYQDTSEVLIKDGKFQEDVIEFTEKDTLIVNNTDDSNYTLTIDKITKLEIGSKDDSEIEDIVPGNHILRIEETESKINLDINTAASRDEKTDSLY